MDLTSRADLDLYFAYLQRLDSLGGRITYNVNNGVQVVAAAAPNPPPPPYNLVAGEEGGRRNPQNAPPPAGQGGIMVIIYSKVQFFFSFTDFSSTQT